MATQSAYDWSNEDLIQQLLNAATKAGISGSGLVIDMAGSSHYVEMHYLAGVVLSRLKGDTRLFKEGDIVRPKTNELTPVAGASRDHGFYPRVVPERLTVHGVFYGGGRWFVTFAEKHKSLWYQDDDGERIYEFAGRCRFKAEDFELVEEKQAA